MHNAVVYSRMRNLGGSGVIVKDAKIWTNSSRVKDRIDEDWRKRKTVMHSDGTTWKDAKDMRVEEYKSGRSDERATQEELEERKHGENILSVEKGKPGILYVENGIERSVSYCDNWGQLWDEITNKKLNVGDSCKTR